MSWKMSHCELPEDVRWNMKRRSKSFREIISIAVFPILAETLECLYAIRKRWLRWPPSLQVLGNAVYFIIPIILCHISYLGYRIKNKVLMKGNLNIYNSNHAFGHTKKKLEIRAPSADSWYFLQGPGEGVAASCPKSVALFLSASGQSHH
jgi:hypothetical protein